MKSVRFILPSPFSHILSVTTYETCGINQFGLSKEFGRQRSHAWTAVDKGYSISADPSDADIIIVNTCGFIEPAKKESIETSCTPLN